MSIVLSQLQKRMADKNPGLIRADINKSIKIILSEMIAALCNKEFGAIELRTVGRFSVKLQKARIGRNPASGSPIQISERKKIRFKASSILLKRLNKSFTEDKISDTY